MPLDYGVHSCGSLPATHAVVRPPRREATKQSPAEGSDVLALMDRLKRLFEARATPKRQAAIVDLVERLYAAEVVSRALKVGDEAPPFLLPNAEGALIASDDLLARGPLVLGFFRGGWCPYCEATMRAMEEALPAIERAGGTFAAIWPETGGSALRNKRERQLSYELLVDVDNAVAMQFGIVFRTPDLYRELLLSGGVDLEALHGNPGWLLPMPATFIITPDRRIRYAFVDPNFTMRAEPDDIVNFLETLKSRPKT